MESFLANIGILAIAFVIIYIYQKMLEWHDSKQSSFYEDKKVYQAADEFAHGASSNEVKALLTACYALDEGDMEKIMSMSMPHKADKDGGYRSFIRSVNHVLGEDIYDEKRRKHEPR
ncbi:hypothetical protein NVS47_16775 [Dehalobacterium formicoaceticum]|uniref:Uncharacterized protein n=1 Tax=Dehalobacterium formicoaceticum TaxID=51515 RepID=A0ABT1Y8D3_9FIRM|nr:hypothetical protein [Dehalobacterium formicoaceticum]MCR6547143.1 hypothetical protein [Dehalobacterium formicoaceticum]